MTEDNQEEQGVLKKSLGLMGVAIAGCAVKTCQCIFDKPEEVKGGIKIKE